LLKDAARDAYRNKNALYSGFWSSKIGEAMDTNTKNALTVAVGGLAGAFAGRWAAPRIGAALGLAFGPWGSAAGAALGGILGAALAKRMAEDVEVPALDNPGVGAALESE
jgi:phage tail tape-measure protein